MTELVEESKMETQGVSSSNRNKKKNLFQFARPGRLVSEVQLYLNTVDSQRIFSGAQAQDAVGLLQFAGKMTELWNAAEKDDPYADWFLLRVYDELIKLRNQMTTSIQNYGNQLAQDASSPNLKLQPFSSEKPVVRSLWFRTQYGYLAANIIAEFDRLMRIVLTAHRVGVLFDRSHENIRNEYVDRILILFKLPFKWKVLSITRKDVESNNDLSEEAKKAMGKLPENVLTKKLRSPFSPYIKRSDQEKNESDEKDKEPKT